MMANSEKRKKSRIAKTMVDDIEYKLLIEVNKLLKITKDYSKLYVLLDSISYYLEDGINIECTISVKHLVRDMKNISTNKDASNINTILTTFDFLSYLYILSKHYNVSGDDLENTGKVNITLLFKVISEVFEPVLIDIASYAIHTLLEFNRENDSSYKNIDSLEECEIKVLKQTKYIRDLMQFGNVYDVYSYLAETIDGIYYYLSDKISIDYESNLVLTTFNLVDILYNTARQSIFFSAILNKEYIESLTLLMNHYNEKGTEKSDGMTAIMTLERILREINKFKIITEGETWIG